MTVGILSWFVPGCKDAWEYTLDTLGRFYERVQTLPARRSPGALAPARGRPPNSRWVKCPNRLRK